MLVPPASAASSWQAACRSYPHCRLAQKHTAAAKFTCHSGKTIVATFYSESTNEGDTAFVTQGLNGKETCSGWIAK